MQINWKKKLKLGRRLFVLRGSLCSFNGNEEKVVFLFRHVLYIFCLYFLITPFHYYNNISRQGGYKSFWAYIFTSMRKPTGMYIWYFHSTSATMLIETREEKKKTKIFLLILSPGKRTDHDRRHETYGRHSGCVGLENPTRHLESM